ILPEDRTLGSLKKTVKKLYAILKRAEVFVHKQYGIVPELTEYIHFVHTVELLQSYPLLGPQQRENEITKKYGAVFVIGIGGALSNGLPHDGRSPDYDDWSSKNDEGYYGLNGDILIWHPVLKRAVEISSMGIRVNKEALIRQLELREQTDRME